MQYIDTATQYKWIHHFQRSIEEAGSYNQVKEKIDRRIKRLLSFLAQSNRVLAILDTAFDIETEDFQYLSRVINKHYPSLEFHLIWLRMDAKETAVKQIGNLTIHYTPKPVDLYDFEKTNFCWSFMDELSLSGKFNTKKPGPVSAVLIRILTAIIPIKSIRKKYRNRLLNGNTRNKHD